MRRLTVETLERLALDIFQALASYRTTAWQHYDLSEKEGQAYALRALGYALGQQHDQGWDYLLATSRGHLRRTLNDSTTSDDVLYTQTLALVLQLRHSPPDARLANPGLSVILVRMAVALEHTFVLTSEDHPPAPPSFPPMTFSPWEQQLAEVMQRLATLEFEDQLPPGHRITSEELLETARTIRETVELACTGGRHRPARVWAEAARRLVRHAFTIGGRGELTFGLAGCLGASLLTVGNVDDRWINDGAIVLCLEKLAVILEPPLPAALLPGAAPGDSTSH